MPFSTRFWPFGNAFKVLSDVFSVPEVQGNSNKPIQDYALMSAMRRALEEEGPIITNLGSKRKRLVEIEEDDLDAFLENLPDDISFPPERLKKRKMVHQSQAYITDWRGKIPPPTACREPRAKVKINPPRLQQICPIPRQRQAHAPAPAAIMPPRAAGLKRKRTEEIERDELLDAFLEMLPDDMSFPPEPERLKQRKFVHQNQAYITHWRGDVTADTAPRERAAQAKIDNATRSLLPISCFNDHRRKGIKSVHLLDDVKNVLKE